ncbi:hypothetical protein LBMAG27_10990 [Bacteroidota bacterium]|nr:hypothetical protein LBMAG27_10990 [Bacteroidota bacterium]
MKNKITLFALLLVLISINKQANAQLKKSVAVISLDTKGSQFDGYAIADVARLEMEKTNQYIMIDKYEIKEVLHAADTAFPKECFSKQCLIRAGQILKADKMLTGAVEVFGEKIIVTLKMIDVQTEAVEKSDVKEYMNMPEQIQNMMQVSVKSLLGLPVDQILLNTLVFYESGASTPTTSIKNSGPRMGVSYVTGDIGRRLMDGSETGGYDGYPVMSSFGYQSEKSYLSVGNFNALFEMLFMVNGLEQQLFVPSVVFMNGFRDNKHGWEFGFGPSISVNKVASGYYENNDHTKPWHLENDYNPNDTTLVGFTPKYVDRADKRGDLRFTSGWVWALGKTFRSGYLNIPVNVYVVPLKEGWHYGMSIGFNVRKNPNKK